MISWTPGEGDDNSTNLFRTVATDNGIPNLSATNEFVVVVNPVVPPPVIQSISLSEDNIATVVWTSVDNGVYRLQYNDNLVDTNWTDVLPDVHASGSTAMATNDAGSAAVRFYRVMVVPLP